MVEITTYLLMTLNNMIYNNARMIHSINIDDPPATTNAILADMQILLAEAQQVFRDFTLQAQAMQEEEQQEQSIEEIQDGLSSTKPKGLKEKLWYPKK